MFSQNFCNIHLLRFTCIPTAILATSTNPTSASHKLETHLQIIEPWAKKWKIKLNTKMRTCYVYSPAGLLSHSLLQ
uniref:Putative rna-directed dna polymerase from mobile element jockey-like protein n=1 Tax=Panstrongylus lignarius TaxID=156445 RepID=A0A224Y565_9HEMI